MNISVSNKKELTPKQFKRNRLRGKLGGVCAGIADYTGFDVSLIRFLFMTSVFFSASATFWIYLGLWYVLPIRSYIVIPDVSKPLKRKLQAIDKQLKKLHKSDSGSVSETLQAYFEAIKELAPRHENARMASLPFERLTEKLSLLIDDHLKIKNRQQIRQQDLEELQTLLIEAEQSFDRFESQEHGSELHAWIEQISPLRSAILARAKPYTQQLLASIENNVQFLFSKLEPNTLTIDSRYFDFKKIAFDYYPNILDQFLNLPKNLAETEILKTGKTAEESLDEQLLILDKQLQDISRSLFQNSAEDLLVHGRFLRQRFPENAFSFDKVSSVKLEIPEPVPVEQPSSGISDNSKPD